ncbi:MAG: hypothetical protein SCM11_08190 [Bacillota bacterium]|nr:hypothetical protein [Bacillota bacterium]
MIIFHSLGKSDWKALRSFRLFLLLIVPVLLILMPLPVYAEASVRLLPVAEIKEQGTYLFTIGWERGDLKTTLIAPDGQRISQDESSAGVSVASRAGITIFRVEQAAVGIWSAECLTDDNGRVGIVVQRLIEPLLVQAVTAVQSDDQSIRIQFALAGEADQDCTWQAWLTTDGNISQGKLIAGGQATTGQSVTQVVALEDVGSYAHYQLVVRAECTQAGFTDFHQAVSVPFAWLAPNSPPPVERLAAVILEQGLELSWAAPPAIPVDAFLLAAYLDDALLPWHAVRLDSSSRSALIPAGPDNNGIPVGMRIEVSLISGGISGLPASLTIAQPISLEDLLNCNLPETGSILPCHLSIPYQVETSLELTTRINQMTTKSTLQDKGTLSIQLPDGLNRIRWQARLDDQLSVAAERLVTTDSIAPLLRIYDDPDGLHTTDAQLLLAGNAGDAIDIRVNGQPVGKDTYNNFQAEITLQLHDNPISITIADRAGNQATYQAIVYRLEPEIPKPWILLAGLPLLILLLVIYILAGKRKERKNP